MELEKQVSSLELSKRLKDLGVKQESAFHWRMWPLSGNKHCDLMPGSGGDNDHISAFTVAELLSLQYENGGYSLPNASVKPEDVANYLAEELCRMLNK